ncbi:MAG: aminoacyl-tRNA hydrolase [bacterium]|nr:aminoacyl-tRNA hydrolase [bacterium]
MDDLRVTPQVTVPSAELQWRFDPSGGPGGQHANKSATRVELSLDVASSVAFDDRLRSRVMSNLSQMVKDGVLTVHAGDSRSQWRNRQIARRRLTETLREAMRPPMPKRRRTKPSRAARERRLSDKHARSETKRLRRRPMNPD